MNLARFRRITAALTQAGNRSARALPSSRASTPFAAQYERAFAAAPHWTPPEYGEYYPRSAMVYAAVKARQDAIARLPLRVLRQSPPAPRQRNADAPGYAHDAPGHAYDTPSRYAHDAPAYAYDTPSRYAHDAPGHAAITSLNARAGGEPVSADHPLQRLLDAPNPFWTRGDLWRATETHLSLWGAAFWALDRDERGAIAEIWPLRPDRMRVIPDADRYIKGFVYIGDGGKLAPYIPEDIVWMRYFNPLDEYAGLSPIAPLRLSADMGLDALLANRKLLQNDSAPGLIIETAANPTDAEVSAFYQRWESRYQGVEKTRRPALLGAGMTAANLGFSPRDMEYIESLRWSLEDIARVFGVPKMMIGDLEHTTYSNFSTARRIFWEDTVSAQLALYEDALQRYLLPHFGDSALTVKFDLSGVEALKESEENKANRRRLYVETGIMSVDEVRREMGLPARE